MHRHRKEIVIIVVSVVIVAVIIVAVVQRGALEGGRYGGMSGSGSAGTPQGSPTWAPAPSNAVAPDEGAATTSVTGGAAVPVAQAPAAPDSTASYRGFSISIAKNAYSPSTVIVNQGDTVNLSITARDGNYGFAQPDYGLNAAINKGQTKTIQFQALQSGKFTFYCGSCGGPSKGPVGYIIVTSH